MTSRLRSIWKGFLGLSAPQWRRTEWANLCLIHSSMPTNPERDAEFMLWDKPKICPPEWLKQRSRSLPGLTKRGLVWDNRRSPHSSADLPTQNGSGPACIFVYHGWIGPLITRLWWYAPRGELRRHPDDCPCFRELS